MRSRPFWGGLFTLLAGVEQITAPFTLRGLPLVIQSPQAGLTSVIAITMIILGVLLWLQPAQRVFLGVVAILLSIASIVYANMGGFLLGMLLGLLGGALSAAWAPTHRPDRSLKPSTDPSPEPSSERSASAIADHHRHGVPHSSRSTTPGET
ncbi:hypothetical protein DQ384_25175 [Sphaerisporangium album]|uniref:Uncharacterized protein n=1 Tax=Sphaerisporangium album TaxID=509200 RepID=A0A367FDR9_9ACTN|nr:DUF6114 domain-containing protein [Sphaerisporangium album]RCG27827.1 hypothetical protein DQ384_25175 [Sphaerisporangium album]